MRVRKEDRADAIERELHEDMMRQLQQVQARAEDRLRTWELILCFLGVVGMVASLFLVIFTVIGVNTPIWGEVGIVGMGVSMIGYSFGIQLKYSRHGTPTSDASFIRLVGFGLLMFFGLLHVLDIANFIKGFIYGV